jgi:hypothetical protein
MNCSTVFDLSRDGLRQTWVMPLGALALTAASGLVAAMTRRSERAWMGWLLLALTATLTSIVIVLPIATYIRYRGVLEHGTYETTEGPVERFTPMPPGGHGNERFTIRDEEFVYSGYANSPFFRQTAADGGPVRKGVYLNVRHVHGNIILLQVCTPIRPPEGGSVRRCDDVTIACA